MSARPPGMPPPRPPPRSPRLRSPAWSPGPVQPLQNGKLAAHRALPRARCPRAVPTCGRTPSTTEPLEAVPPRPSAQPPFARWSLGEERVAHGLGCAAFTGVAGQGVGWGFQRLQGGGRPQRGSSIQSRGARVRPGRCQSPRRAGWGRRDAAPAASLVGRPERPWLLPPQALPARTARRTLTTVPATAARTEAPASTA